jgi:hypothetical protein
MKRMFLTLMLLCFVFLSVSAQTNFKKDDQVASFTVGFGGRYTGLGSTLYGDVSKVPFLALSYEKGIKDKLFDDKSSLGVGGMIGYTGAESDWFESSTYVIEGNCLLHYYFMPKLDTYGGIGIAYDIVTWKWKLNWGSFTDDGAESGIGIGLIVGSRYYVNEKINVIVEFGTQTIISLGVGMKF